MFASVPPTHFDSRSDAALTARPIEPLGQYAASAVFPVPAAR